MAEHFLDTETRHDIPLTALVCADAGLSVDGTRHVWRYEVSPAVSANLWSVAGEWAGWDREWLVATIERVRAKVPRQPGWLRRFEYRISVHFNHGVGVAIERCVATLLAARADERAGLATGLATLARLYFDCGPEVHLDDTARQRLRALYPEPFVAIVMPATTRRERIAADRRVRALLRAAF